MEIWQLHEGGWSLKPSAKCTDSFTFLFRSITSLTAYSVMSLRSAQRMCSAGQDVECLTTWITDGFFLFAIGVWLRSISDVHLQWRLYSVTRSVAAIRICRVIDRNRPWAVAEDTVFLSLGGGHISSAPEQGKQQCFQSSMQTSLIFRSSQRCPVANEMTWLGY